MPVFFTYTSVYTDSEPGRVFWGVDEELSDGGSPRVTVYGYNGLPMQPVAPPSQDYIPNPEEPQTPPVPQDEDEREHMFIQPHDPEYVPEPIYPEYIPLEDEHVFPIEEQPLPPIDSPTAKSQGYVAESDLEEDPEEYEDDEIEDGPVDYPMDGGDDGDDDDGDSSGDDADDEDDDEGKGWTRIMFRLQASISLPLEKRLMRLIATPTPSHPHLSQCDHHLCRERLARSLRDCSTQAFIVDSNCRIPSPLLPPYITPYSIHTPPVDRRDDVPESELPPRKRLCLSTLGPWYKIGESSTARPIGGQGIDYGFVSTVDAKAR
ncbi:hypothetical protein Tco_1164894 [Tanacetum coccineum]